ncbi:hypothetical protein N431DRAFT_466333 [Stipitochalara longipes BDJ]|nr:hypothetical protein N431DRAFT_466333 [Stipitochalara longipes BDJ]
MEQLQQHDVSKMICTFCHTNQSKFGPCNVKEVIGTVIDHPCDVCWTRGERCILLELQLLMPAQQPLFPDRGATLQLPPTEPSAPPAATPDYAVNTTIPSEGLPVATVAASQVGTLRQATAIPGTVLTTPICEPISNVLNLEIHAKIVMNLPDRNWGKVSEEDWDCPFKTCPDRRQCSERNYKSLQD